ncbi:hypothetical protein BVG19_g3768 [[Candida] boidinii]|nr:hypothetical protein BVG19_g3768 [[Candida] boidinii]OWB52604.1 hypothetical protein B5S27_g4181 [[Candida] boidinii]
MKSNTQTIPKPNVLSMNTTSTAKINIKASQIQEPSVNSQVNYKNEMSLLIQQIERFLKIPVSVIENTTNANPNLVDQVNSKRVVREISIDCSILSCGCLISEELANLLSINSKLICPNCHQSDTYLLSPLNEFRELTSFIKNFKSEFNRVNYNTNGNNTDGAANVTELVNDINSDVILEDSKRVSVVKSTTNRRRRSSSRKSNKDSQIINSGNQQMQQQNPPPVLQQTNSTQQIPNQPQTNKTPNFSLLTAFHEILTEVDKNSTSSTSPTNTKIIPKLQQPIIQQSTTTQSQPLQKTRTSISELSSSAHNSIQTSIESNGNLTEYTKLIQQDGNQLIKPPNNENISNYSHTQNHSRSPVNRSIIYQNNNDTEMNTPNTTTTTTANPTNNELISNGSRKLSLIQTTQSNLTKGLQRLSSNISTSNNSPTNNISHSPSDSFFNHSISFKRENSNATTTKSSSSPSNNNHGDENDKELLYAKNFPFYRKLYQYNTHQSKIFLKNRLSKIFINTSISYDLTKMCLLSEKKWEVYKINPNKPELSPVLVCCGKNNGDYGLKFDNLNKISKNEILRNSNFQINNQTLDSLNNWEHLICKVSENYLIVAGTRGILRIIDLNDNGKLLYTYQSKFPIRSIDFSNDEKLISVAVTGKDKYSSFEQPFIILLKLEIIESCDGDNDDEADYYFHSINSHGDSNGGNSGKDSNNGSNIFKNNYTLSPISTNKTISKLDNNQNVNWENTDPNEMFEGMFNFSSILPKTSNMKFIGGGNKCKDSSDKVGNGNIFLKVSSYPFTLPYRDPINTLQFSPNSEYLICSTALESRFIEINITDPMKPKLIMKSQRKLDTSLDSEGITDIQFFTDNRLISLTSVAYNASPIIIDSKITSINNGNNGPDAIVKPKLLARIEEVGTTIHKTVISPRGDAVGFLDRNGDVYLLSTPRMDDNDTKRLVILTTVASAYRVRESASMRFDKDGYKLFILDRKGVLTIADFTAGTIEDHDVTRSKIIG